MRSVGTAPVCVHACRHGSFVLTGYTGRVRAAMAYFVASWAPTMEVRDAKSAVGCMMSYTAISPCILSMAKPAMLLLQ
jgi:hypothetical protein